jgi:fructose-bisphosphate aldolase/2-amino-3,7-dideoxy-D-threo-hept-6-ulosonate synthase
MAPGIGARLDRIGIDGKYVNIPMDHGITIGATDGLRDIESTIDAVTRAGANSVLTQKGLAPRVHPNKNDAGYLVHCNASTVIGPASNDKRVTCTVEEALRAGADAVSIHLNVGSDYEPRQIEQLADLVAEAHQYGLPVLAMTYARGGNLEGEDPEHDAEYLAHAVRLGEELGADVLKTAYSGDSESFERVIAATGKPVIVAGGSPRDDRAMLEQVRGAMDAGAAGVSTGRSAFQHDQPGAYVRAVSAIVHDDVSVETALSELGDGGSA